ncbi:lysosomal acid phosphatase isoform X2 [Acyrthosiphon pisum]|uniref:acid phosphatase n=1 Tax=Acyrthosiphon pisum TaxID=7029 RepID=A0A8R2JMT0_ACYPI|nr:lysosomal acid phosphatase isoform X2 [Acyrthosiphon pisum]
MLLNFKKVTLVIGLSLTVIVICSVLYVFTVGWEQQNNDVVGPGLFSDSSLKFVSVKGKHNMYKKGQLFRRLYNGFLSDLYLDSEILIKTTNTSRTFMSAAMVLAGMYPPKNYQKWSNSETVWQPIPIYSNSPDHVHIIGRPGICPSIDSFDANVTHFLDYSTDKNITALKSFLSENCGQPMTSKNVPLLYDLFLCQIAEGLSLPEWIKPYHLATMESIYSEVVKNILFENTTLMKLFVGPLLNEIGLNMELISNNYNKARKMHLYSGSDISIGMAMSFLGHIIEMPGFGASLHFHMYYDVTKGYTVKAFYFDRWDNEKSEEISIPICGNPCKFEDFKKLLINNFSEKWEYVCQKV